MKDANGLAAIGGHIADLAGRVAAALIGPPRQRSPRLAVPFCLMCIGALVVLAAHVSDARIALLLFFSALCGGMTAPVVAFLMARLTARIYTEPPAHHLSNGVGLLFPPDLARTRRSWGSTY